MTRTKRMNTGFFCFAEKFGFLQQSFIRQDHASAKIWENRSHHPQGSNHYGQVPREFRATTSRQHQHIHWLLRQISFLFSAVNTRRNGRCGWRRRVAVKYRMADEVHSQPGRPPRIPVFLKRNDAQNKIEIFSHLMHATFARRPDLRGNQLNDSRTPIVKPAGLSACARSNRVGKPAIETGKINADDHIRLSGLRERNQIV